jgi:hypothetical protein
MVLDAVQDGSATTAEVLRIGPAFDTETEVEQDGKRFLLRAPARPAANLALRAADVALPPTVRHSR